MLRLFAEQIGILNFFVRGFKIKFLKKFKKKIVYKLITGNKYNIHKWDPSGTEIFMTQCFSDWGNEYLFLDSIRKRNNGSFIDVGCHSGYFPSLFKNYFEKIIGFEPSKKCNDILKELNNDKFSYYQYFVGNKNMDVTGKESDAGYSFYNDNNQSNQTLTQNLKQITLDSFCNEKKIEKITGIKIDVDGIDFEVLEGAKEIIKINRPSILIENYSEELFNYFKDFNYSLFSIVSIKSKPFNLFLEELNHYDSNKWIKMVCCIPNEFKKNYEKTFFKGNIFTGINKRKIIDFFEIELNKD